MTEQSKATRLAMRKVARRRSREYLAIQPEQIRDLVLRGFRVYIKAPGWNPIHILPR